MINHLFGSIRAPSSRTLLVGAACFCIGATLGSLLQAARKEQHIIRSPKHTILPKLSEGGIAALPYPPDVLPGGRDVITPYGSIQVFEWGPEDGEKVLFIHGISTPLVALGDLAHELAGRGYRVMLFDLFGRGYSDAPSDITYDARLYVTQILLVTASSQLSWSHFHLVGYSLGGCLAVSFATYFPQRLKSLASITGGGLIRQYHVSWKSRLLYNSGLLPEWLVRLVVRKRIRPAATPSEAVRDSDVLLAENKMGLQDGDANGGVGFDSASISRHRPGTTVSSIIAWQIDHHEGFITAFLSTIRNAPIYAPQEDWQALSSTLAMRRRKANDEEKSTLPSGLSTGRILLILGADDPVVVASENIEDAKGILGDDGVDSVVLPGGHELPITTSLEVADCLERFWRQ